MRHEQLTDDLQEQASLYAAGAMAESQRREYARHLEEDQCAVCLSEVNELQTAVSMLAFSTPSRSPSPTVRERLREQARSVNSVSSIRSRSPLRRFWVDLIAGAAAVGALVFALAVTRANTELRRLADSLNSRIAQLEIQLSQSRTSLISLTSPEVRIVDLRGQRGNDRARGRIFWDQSKRKWFFYVRDLPQLPADKSYQLWFVPASGNPISAVVFNTESDGSTERQIDVPEAVVILKAAAVTTEPAGGMPQPTGQFALLGAL